MATSSMAAVAPKARTIMDFNRRELRTESTAEVDVALNKVTLEIETVTQALQLTTRDKDDVAYLRRKKEQLRRKEEQLLLRQQTLLEMQAAALHLHVLVTAPAPDSSINVKLVYPDDDSSLNSDRVDEMTFNDMSFIVSCFVI